MDMPDGCDLVASQPYWDTGIQAHVKWCQHKRVTDADPHAAATFITRRRHALGALAKWYVEVDGNRLAKIANGKVVRVAVAQGPHKVVVCTKSGLSCSNELDLDSQPGGASALICRINPSFVGTYFGGLSALPTQIRNLRSAAGSGGVVRGMIELVDDDKK